MLNYFLTVEDIWHQHHRQELGLGVFEVNLGIETLVLNESDVVKFRGNELIGKRSKISFLVFFDLNLDLPNFSIEADTTVLFGFDATHDEDAGHALVGVLEYIE